MFRTEQRKFVIMGAPGSGKGTQATAIVQRYGVCHLSTGDMLREAVANKTQEGLVAESVMKKGNLVPDEVVFTLLKAGMKKPECKKGFLIDGVPRTLSQAKTLDVTVDQVDRVVLLNVPDDAIVKRTSGRWMHQPSGRTYHETFNPPKVQGKDDVTGEPLTQRHDDKPEVVKHRLQVYRNNFGPIIMHYQTQGVLLPIDGSHKPNEVRQDVLAELDKFRPKKPWWKFWRRTQ